MFPIREFDGKFGNVPHDERLEKNRPELWCDEVSSSNDVLENVYSFEENADQDNFDPSLFCPDIILELGDTPIFFNNEQMADSVHNPKPLSDILGHTEIEERLDATFHLTTEETELKNTTYGIVNPVQYTKVHCTACHDHLGSALSEQDNRFVHPLLKVLICKECYDFYTSGDFEKDEDGSEMYCRWCGQGGSVMCCSKCAFVFCSTCIRSNLGRKKLAEIKESDDWICFNCDPLQLIELRVQCAELMEYVQKEMSRVTTLANAESLRNIDHSKCCSQTKNVAAKKKKKRGSSPVDPTYDPFSDSSLPRRNTVPGGNTTNLVRKPAMVTPTPKPANATSEVKMSIPGNKASIENPGNKQTLRFTRQPVGKPRLNPSLCSANLYRAPLNLQQLKMLSNHVLITSSDKAQAPKTMPRYVMLQKTPVPSTGQEQKQIQNMKSSCGKIVRSACKINSDLSCNLLQLRREKAAATGLEHMVLTHNKLQDVLNKSINSLIKLQKEFADCKEGNPKTKLMQQPITNYFCRQLGHVAKEDQEDEVSSVKKK